jgi:hypothetical protein
MLVLYRDVRCPACKGTHDLCLEERATIMTYRPHAFLCPVLGQKIQWRPNVFAHRVQTRPESSISLDLCDLTPEAAT